MSLTKHYRNYGANLPRIPPALVTLWSYRQQYSGLPFSKCVSAVGTNERVQECKDATDGGQSTEVEYPIHSEGAHEPPANDRCEEASGPPD